MPEKTLLVNLYHVMVGLQRVLYIKLLTSKQPRSQVNKYHADVLNHKGGTLIMHGTKPVPYIVQNNHFYVPLLYAYQTVPNVLSQAKRGARAPRQYEIDYLNLLFLYFSIDSPPLTSDTLLVDAFNIKCSNSQTPIHFRTLNEHQQHERNRLLATITRLTQMNAKPLSKSQQHSTTKSTGESIRRFLSRIRNASLLRSGFIKSKIEQVPASQCRRQPVDSSSLLLRSTLVELLDQATDVSGTFTTTGTHATTAISVSIFAIEISRDQSISIARNECP